MTIPYKVPEWALLQRIWSHSRTGNCAVATLDRTNDRWQEYSILYPSPQLLIPLLHERYDIFFAPRRFHITRTNENASPSRLYYADLDGVDPRELALEPTIWWETSPNNWQGIWVCTEDNENWTALNRAITYSTGADKGGWHASKMLRVPGSTNWKRDGWQPQPSSIVDARPTYPLETLRKAFTGGSTITIQEPVGNHPDLPAAKDREWLLRLYWPEMSLSARSWLVKMKPADRSRHIVKVVRELWRCGFTANEIFLLVYGSDFNKFKDRPEVLWQQIQRYSDDYRPR